MRRAKAAALADGLEQAARRLEDAMHDARKNAAEAVPAALTDTYVATWLKGAIETAVLEIRALAEHARPS